MGGGWGGDGVLGRGGQVRGRGEGTWGHIAALAKNPPESVDQTLLKGKHVNTQFQTDFYRHTFVSLCD